MPLKPKRRRPLTTQDGTTIPRGKPVGALCYGESYPVAGLPLAADERLTRPRNSITFDGAMPSPKD